jgi:hypothetical protein
MSCFWLVVLFEGAKDGVDVLWCSGVMVLWCSGVQVLWCYGVRVKSDSKLQTKARWWGYQD